MPHSPDAWVNDIFQRNQINRGLIDAGPDDIIIVSDLDEVLRAEAVDSMRKEDDDVNIWGLRMPLFNFKFNYMLTTADKYTVWGMATRKKFMVPADEFRRQRFNLVNFPYAYKGNGVRLVEHAGWQWTYLGDTEFARNKIKSFAHTETNVPEIVENLDVERSVQHGDGIGYSPDYRFAAVQLDDYFPKVIRDNLEKYQKYLVADPVKQVSDFIPVNIVDTV
jgi:beta-1,4-mannosyl-glycoprotein beta-1,4-N-acetylglucosaminyltransferase